MLHRTLWAREENQVVLRRVRHETARPVAGVYESSIEDLFSPTREFVDLPLSDPGLIEGARGEPGEYHAPVPPFLVEELLADEEFRTWIAKTRNMRRENRG